MSLEQLSDEEYTSLEQYVDGTMPPQDRAAWAEQMRNDTRLQAAHDELIELLKALKQSDLERTMRAKMAEWDRAATVVGDSAPSPATPAGGPRERWPVRNPRTRTLRWLAAAATLVVIAIGAWYLRPSAEQKLFQKYFVPDPRSQYTMGPSGADEARLAMGAYQSQKYEEAIPHFQAALAAQKSNDTLTYFLANALMAEGNTATALPMLQNLATQAQASPFQQLGNWLLALCYLDSGNKSKAITILEPISQEKDHPMRSTALSLLSELQ